MPNPVLATNSKLQLLLDGQMCKVNPSLEDAVIP